jgi:ATP-dependent DNA helicase RecQ
MVTPSQKVIRIINQMVDVGLLKRGIQLSAYLNPKGKNRVTVLLNRICSLDNALLSLMKMEDPDSDKGEWVDFHLIKISQRLKKEGVDNAPDTLKQILKGISLDGKGLAGKKGSLIYKQISKDRFKIRLQRSWASITETIRSRQS